MDDERMTPDAAMNNTLKSNDQLTAEAQAVGVSTAELVALFDARASDYTLGAWLDMWSLGKRTLPEALVQIAIHLSRDKGELMAALTKLHEQQSFATIRVLSERDR